MKMKKILLLILVIVMSFTLTACGGDNNDETDVSVQSKVDENSAAVQVKMDEVEALVEEIISVYEDQGYGETHKAELDVIRGQIDQTKANHQEILDGGGYDDETAALFGSIIDNGIEEYTKVLESLYADLDLDLELGAEAVEEKFEEGEREAFRSYYSEYLVKMSEDYHSVIVNKFIEAVESEDETILMETLKEILILNAHLYEELILFETEYENINYLQSLFIAAVAQRELGYVEVMLALDNADVTQEEANAAFDVLDESDELFAEFITLSEALKEYYGF